MSHRPSIAYSCTFLLHLDQLQTDSVRAVGCCRHFLTPGTPQAKQWRVISLLLSCVCVNRCLKDEQEYLPHSNNTTRKFRMRLSLPVTTRISVVVVASSFLYLFFLLNQCHSFLKINLFCAQFSKNWVRLSGFLHVTP